MERDVERRSERERERGSERERVTECSERDVVAKCAALRCGAGETGERERKPQDLFDT